MPRQRQQAFDIIPAASYPAVLRHYDAIEFLRKLRSDEMAARVNNVMTARGCEICDAVRGATVRLEAAARAGAFETVYAEAHEIRGLAHTGGLPASGSIADRLCLYLDAMHRTAQPVDGGIVGLHVGAIVRSAHAEDEATRLGSEVAEQLGALVARRLGSAAPQRFR